MGYCGSCQQLPEGQLIKAQSVCRRHLAIKIKNDLKKQFISKIARKLNFHFLTRMYKPANRNKKNKGTNDCACLHTNPSSRIFLHPPLESSLLLHCKMLSNSVSNLCLFLSL